MVSVIREDSKMVLERFFTDKCSLCKAVDFDESEYVKQCLGTGQCYCILKAGIENVMGMENANPR